MVVQSKKMASHNQSRQVHPAVAGKLSEPGWAWAAYQPDARQPWNLALAGHLFRRAAFGAGWDQLQQALSDGPHELLTSCCGHKLTRQHSTVCTTGMRPRLPARSTDCERGGCAGLFKPRIRYWKR